MSAVIRPHTAGIGLRPKADYRLADLDAAKKSSARATDSAPDALAFDSPSSVKHLDSARSCGSDQALAVRRLHHSENTAKSGRQKSRARRPLVQACVAGNADRGWLDYADQSQAARKHGRGQQGRMEVATQTDKYAAGEQGLGYVYQIRFALVHLMKQDDETLSLLIEADDDVQLKDVNGKDTLISLKHKQAGETVGTLSVDFWKSVRIWLDRYNRDGKLACNHAYCMVTTARVGPSSMLKFFQAGADPKPASFTDDLLAEVHGSASELSKEINDSLAKLTPAEREDFLARIVIADRSSRINELESAIASQLKSVVPKFRVDVRERLEGWWLGQAIDVIRKQRAPITSSEVWLMVSAISSQYHDERLPITFEEEHPPNGIDPLNDPRQFVQQLRAIGVPTAGLEMAILDFYRAVSQRSHWLRVNVLIGGEMQKFERRLVGEWKRAKVWAEIDGLDSEAQLQEAGRRLYKWAENQSSHLQIRKQVTEDFLRRGSFHILADEKPEPRVHWHPKFLETLKATVQVTA